MELESHHGKHHDSNMLAHAFTNVYNDLRVFCCLCTNIFKNYLSNIYDKLLTLPALWMHIYLQLCVKIVCLRFGIECIKICKTVVFIFCIWLSN